MNSDSESQDSDDGRRFRFATTRKDTSSVVNEQKAYLSKNNSRQSPFRSRSRDRFSHDSKSRYQYNNDKNRDSYYNSKELKYKSSKDDYSYSKDSYSSDQIKKKSRKSSSIEKHSKHKNKSHKRKHKSRDKSSSREKIDSNPKIDKDKFQKSEISKTFDDQLNEKEISKQEYLKSHTPPLISLKNDSKKKEKEQNITVNKKNISYISCSKPHGSSDQDKSKNSVIGPVKSHFAYDQDKDLKKSFTSSQHSNRNKIIGPILPSNIVLEDQPLLTMTEDVSSVNEDDDDDNDDDGDDDWVIGPIPVDHPSLQDSKIQIQLENRAKRVQAEFIEKLKPQKNKREEWMTELPTSHADALGLGPRKFKTREGPDLSDRSMWTDTPADRLRKQREKEENRFVKSEHSSKKIKVTCEPTRELSDEPEEKQESLLDMHLKTLKKKKKKLEKEAKKLGISTRRPFDREIDLQTNRLDAARKKKIFEKAALLNDRFAAGKY